MDEYLMVAFQGGSQQHHLTHTGFQWVLVQGRRSLKLGSLVKQSSTSVCRFDRCENHCYISLVSYVTAPALITLCRVDCWASLPQEKL